MKLSAVAAIVIGAFLCAAEAGKTASLSPLQVRKGVLVDADGREVALWGVNYQASLYWEYTETFRPMGFPLEAAPLKRAVDEDLAHLRRMGASIVRVHLSPSDFTDTRGQLVDTVFLDVFDYLVARCREENFYVFISLFNRIGVRDQANYLKDSFASKGGENHIKGQPDKRPYIFCPEFVAPFQSYVRALLHHRNRYDGIALKDDAGIAVWEIINEPEYLNFSDADDPKFRSFRTQWERWLREKGREASAETFNQFRGEYVGAYIDEMADLIRTAGARQPIAWSMNWPGYMKRYPDIHRALAASKVDAVTFSCYVKNGLPPKDQINWFDMPDASRVNQLERLFPPWGKVWNFDFVTTPSLRDKAKIVYEFESVNNDSAYIYPAMARLFRRLGAQIACMWEYDPLAAAEENCVPTHFLNYFSSPRKALSFLIGAKAFRTLPRGGEVAGDHSANDAIFGEFGVSFDGDISLHTDGETVMYSNHWSNWTRGDRDFPLPGKGLRRLAGFGRSPLVDYKGTGLYQLSIGPNRIDLEITPNVTKVGKLWAAEEVGNRGWKGKTGPPPKAVAFDNEPRRFTLYLPTWGRNVIVKRADGGGALAHTEGSALSFVATPGRYAIERVPERGK